MSAPPHRRTWLRRHVVLVVAIVAVLALGADVGYQVYAARIQHRNAVVATKVERLSASACSSTQFLYDILNALVDDSSPHFGSPPDGPIVPGARVKLIGRLYSAERGTVPRLRKQGCKVTVPG